MSVARLVRVIVGDGADAKEWAGVVTPETATDDCMDATIRVATDCLREALKAATW